jgi:sugar phosphate isomerase/epimerase
MNIACSTTAFTRLPLEDALSRISALGFTHVDLLMMENWAHINPSELTADPGSQVRRVNSLLRGYNLKAAALNANVSAPMTSREPEAVSRILNEGRTLVDFAKGIKAGVVVLQPGSVRDGEEAEDAFQASASVLRELAAYAKSRNITLAIESHSGSLAEQYTAAMRFVAEVAGLKIAYDPSHFVKVGLELEGSRALLAHSAHVHLRDAVNGDFQAPMGRGTLDFMWVFEAIDASGYRGAISIEYLDNKDADILKDVSTLKSLLEARYAHI